MHIEDFGFMSLNDVCHRPLALVPELYIDDRILVSTSPEGPNNNLMHCAIWQQFSCMADVSR